ncbi:hypothetical protein [Microtetraspora malaysiensis]|uniref:hypothetical protein n=1 Tax=Microtetraspora malaysiensis TaxID=161358 RepID=UPI00082A9928|nr:hypothetical protein [Microtetraspora malaysiensis]
MTDPVLIAMAAVCARGLVVLVDALAERIVLRARRELIRSAISLPPGTEVEQERAGWRARRVRR